MNRRGFLIRFGGLIATLPALPAGGAPPPRAVAAPPAGFPPETWQTIAAVQAHMFPSEPNAPGAREIRAEAYLRGVLADPRLASADRAFLIEGVESIEKLARSLTGKRFVELSHDEREAVLRGFEATSDGKHWLAETLGYLMEALLGDPVYGGNPDAIGWRWLAHTPGFPRPPADKRYFLL